MTTRRDLLLGAAAGAIGALLPRRARPDEPAAEARWIDAHSHVWTRDVRNYPLARGTTLENLDPPSFTAERLLRVASAEQVDRVVLIAHHPYYGYDNGYMIDSAKRFPGRFRVVGMIDESKPDPAARMKQLLKQGVTGFRIAPGIRGRRWLDNDGMRRMWSCAAETRQAICCLINPENLPEVDRFCAAFPDTPVVIDHFARIGADGEIRDDDVNRLCDLARHAHTHVKVSAYYALGRKKPPYDDLIPMIRRLYERFGAKRLMWASDSPYQLVNGHTYGASISLVRDRIDFMSEAERRELLRGTAERVYFLD